MTAVANNITIIRAKKAFRDVSQTEEVVPGKKKKTVPFSMRLTDKERAFLDEHCGDRSWAGFIRERVFAEHAAPRRNYRRPKIDDKDLVASLSGLGQSRLASNVNQLAKAASMGALDVTEDTEKQLEEAYQAIIAMRNALFMALGLKL